MFTEAHQIYVFRATFKGKFMIDSRLKGIFTPLKAIVCVLVSFSRSVSFIDFSEHVTLSPTYL